MRLVKYSRLCAIHTSSRVTTIMCIQVAYTHMHTQNSCKLCVKASRRRDVTRHTVFEIEVFLQEKKNV